MPTWDLTTRENWQLLVSEQRTVVYKNGTLPTQNKYNYTPISPFYVTSSSHVLLVGTRSNSARLHWFLGARVSQYLYVAPSSNFTYTSGVQVADIKKAGLNRLTLVEFKNYNVIPYVLELDIPYWLEDIYIEVWEYIGQIENPNYRSEIEEILERLSDIEARLIEG